MKTIERFLVIVSFLAIHVSLNAQTARQVLDKTAGVITSKGGATARFSISGSKIKSEGSISLKGNKFYASTPQATIWFNGKTQWSYMKSSNEVNISTPNEAKQAQIEHATNEKNLSCTPGTRQKAEYSRTLYNNKPNKLQAQFGQVQTGSKLDIYHCESGFHQKAGRFHLRVPVQGLSQG